MECYDHMGQDPDKCGYCELISDHEAKIVRLTAELEAAQESETGWRRKNHALTAERDAWKANAKQLRETGMICINSFVTGIKQGNERKHWNCAVDSHDHLSAARAKLKGDV